MATPPRRQSYMGAMISLASAAFGVVAALAWNAAITEMFRLYLPGVGGLIGLFIYAILVSVIGVIVIVNLGNMAERAGE